MTQVIAPSVSIAVLGGIWAFLALGPLSGFVLVGNCNQCDFHPLDHEVVDYDRRFLLVRVALG